MRDGTDYGINETDNRHAIHTSFSLSALGNLSNLSYRFLLLHYCVKYRIPVPYLFGIGNQAIKLAFLPIKIVVNDFQNPHSVEIFCDVVVIVRSRTIFTVYYLVRPTHLLSLIHILVGFQKTFT